MGLISRVSSRTYRNYRDCFQKIIKKMDEEDILDLGLDNEQDPLETTKTNGNHPLSDGELSDGEIPSSENDEPYQKPNHRSPAKFKQERAKTPESGELSDGSDNDRTYNGYGDDNN